MLNKFETCYGCPDRSLSFRSGCPGWAAREAEKAEKYERNRLHAVNFDTYSREKEMLMRRNRIKMRGYGG